MPILILALAKELCFMDHQGYLVVEGKRSWFHVDKAWSSTATGSRTSRGMIVGQVLQTFSGAYSGENSWTFIKIGRKVYISDYSEPFKTVGDTVCLAPRPMSQPLSRVNGVAKIFRRGKFQLVGPAYQITEFDGKLVKGYYLADARGELTSFMALEPGGENVYTQWFSWSRGKRTLGEKVLLRSKGPSSTWP